MFAKAMLQRSQQVSMTPMKSWFALTSLSTRSFASKSHSTAHPDLTL